MASPSSHSYVIGLDGAQCCHGGLGGASSSISMFIQTGPNYSERNLNPNFFKPDYVFLTTPLTLAEQEKQKQEGLFEYHKYGNLAREGISCTICHHIEVPPPRVAV